MCITCSDGASALCAYCIPMLHAQQVHTLYVVAFALYAYLVRCRIHNMRIPRQMMHAQHVYLCITFKMLHAPYAHILSDVACTICAYLLRFACAICAYLSQTDTFCIFSVGLALHYAEAAKCWYFGDCSQTYFEFSCKSEEVWWLRKVV
jgi:hypothetical protein